MKMPRPAKHFVSSQVSSRHTIAEGESSLERTRQRLEFEEEEETVQDGEGDETMQSGDDTLRVTADEDSEASMKTTPSGSNADESHGPTTSLLGAAVGQVEILSFHHLSKVMCISFQSKKRFMFGNHS